MQRFKSNHRYETVWVRPFHIPVRFGNGFFFASYAASAVSLSHCSCPACGSSAAHAFKRLPSPATSLSIRFGKARHKSSTLRFVLISVQLQRFELIDNEPQIEPQAEKLIDHTTFQPCAFVDNEPQIEPQAAKLINRTTFQRFEFLDSEPQIEPQPEMLINNTT